MRIYLTPINLSAVKGTSESSQYFTYRVCYETILIRLRHFHHRRYQLITNNSLYILRSLQERTRAFVDG